MFLVFSSIARRTGDEILCVPLKSSLVCYLQSKGGCSLIKWSTTTVSLKEIWLFFSLAACAAAVAEVPTISFGVSILL